jgi:biopolymer transport protein TolQ
VQTFGSDSFLSMAFSSGAVVAGVLIILVMCSIISWAVILYKVRIIRRANVESRQFLEVFWEARSFQTVHAQTDRLRQSPLAQLFRAGYAEWRKRRQRFGGAEALEEGDLSMELGHLESVERTLRRTAEAETARLERMLVFLATVGSTAPFIGLFGTVWGIMESFRNIGASGSASLAIVAPGISEALIATATGLAAAIPAVIAYNYLNNTIRVLSTEMDAFVAEFLNIVSYQSTPRSKERA